VLSNERAGGAGSSLEKALVLLVGGEGAMVAMVKYSSSAVTINPLAVKLVMLSSTPSVV